MKAIKNSVMKKLVAVVASDGGGLFILNDEKEVCFISIRGLVRKTQASFRDLDDVLKSSKARIGVYEGESIILQF